ncbi:hypothetical protein MHYMCMPASI_00941 [Hyalomma marginatum]|uniref:Uncharacterized protein n=1 Tax=Hyalomma marginatum TaxID=34627 RepID=A0A8S4C485_9ACAR|nr:hypothetical protein MHYMCMPASI_00941 [Hyalomma marginatum]
MELQVPPLYCDVLLYRCPFFLFKLDKSNIALNMDNLLKTVLTYFVNDILK